MDMPVSCRHINCPLYLAVMGNNLGLEVKVFASVFLMMLLFRHIYATKVIPSAQQDTDEWTTCVLFGRMSLGISSLFELLVPKTVTFSFNDV